MSSRPQPPGGPWQFDPPPPRKTAAMLLNSYCKKLTPEEKKDILEKGVDDFYSGGVLAACWLRHKVHYVIDRPDVPERYIKEALWRYNGAAYGSSDKSSYVMNRMDKKHENMLIIGSIPLKDGGRKQIREVDKRLGALVVYRELLRLGI